MNRPPAGRRPANRIWPVLLPAMLALVLYANTLGHDYVLDDHTLITENWVTQLGVSGLGTIFTTDYRHGYRSEPGSSYRPLPLALLAVEWELAPDRPALSHAVNVLIYALLCALIYVALLRLTRSVPLALVAALLFTAHPIHTEVVANIKGREDMLALGFSLFALLLALRNLEGRSRWALPGALTAYFLALISKESAATYLVVFPAAFLLVGVPRARAARLGLLFLVPLALYLTARWAALESSTSVDVPFLNNFLVGAPDLATRLATAVWGLGTYLRLLVIPYPLVSDYSWPQFPFRTWGDPAVLASLTLYLGLTAGMVWGLMRRHSGGLACLLFLAPLSIASNLVLLIGTNLGERLLFAPSVGFCLLAALGLIRGADLLGRRNARASLLTVTAVLVASGGWLTLDRNRDWATDQVLALTDVERHPNSAKLQYHAGLSRLHQAVATADSTARAGFLDLAATRLEQAIHLYTGYPEAFIQLGVTRYHQGDLNAALESYRAAIRLQPGSAEAFSNLSAVYVAAQDLEAAETVLRRAVELRPRYADAWANLGAVLALGERWPESIGAYGRALECDPRRVSAHRGLAAAYGAVGNTALEEAHRAQARSLAGS